MQVTSNNSNSNSNTVQPYVPTDLDVLRRTSFDLEQAIDDGNFPEGKQLAEELTNRALTTKIDVFFEDPHFSASTIAQNLVKTLTNEVIQQNPLMKLVVARAARSYLDICLWRSVHRKQAFAETTADEMREKVADLLRIKVSDEVALNHELECCQEALKALPASHHQLYEETGKTVLGLLLSAVTGGLTGEVGVDAIPEALSEVKKLKKLITKNWIMDVLMIFWTGRLAARSPQLFEQTDGRIAKAKKNKRPIYICSLMVLSEIIWSGTAEMQEKALTRLIDIGANKDTKKSKYKWVRFEAARQIKALAKHSNRSVVQRAEAFLSERQAEESDPQIKEEINGGPLQWNPQLRLVEPDASDSVANARLKEEQRLLQKFLVEKKLEDPLLLEFAKAHPDLTTLDLSPYQGISPEGFKAAVALCPVLDTIVLRGHPQIGAKQVLDVAPRNLNTLVLEGPNVSDQDLVALGKLGQLECLELYDCEDLKGAGIGKLKVRSLTLSNCPITTGLSTLLEGHLVESLTLENLPIDLYFLKKGKSLKSLALKGFTVNDDFSSCTNLEHLDLANSKLGEKVVLPPTLVSLRLDGALGITHNLFERSMSHLLHASLRGCGEVGDREIAALMDGAPHLKSLDTAGTRFTGLVEGHGKFGELTTLTLEYNEQARTEASSRDVGSRWWADFAKRIPLLQRLTVLNTSSVKTREWKEMLENLPQLLDLSAPDQEQIAEELIRHIIAHPTLRHVRLKKALKRIESLDLTGSQITDDHVERILSQCTSLTDLDLTDCKELTGDGLKALIRLPKLTSLEVEGCDEMVRGEKLDLSDLPELSNAILQQILGAFPDLKRISLSGCFRLKDAALSNAINLSRGTHTYDLSRCPGASKKTFGSLKRAGVRNLALNFCKLNADDVQSLARMQNLKIVDLTGCRAISEATDLDLQGCAVLSDSLFQSLILDAPSLQTLVLKGCNKLSAQGITDALAACPSLLSLNLLDCPQIEEEALKRMWTRAPSLAEILHGGKKIERPDDTPVVERWPAERTHTSLPVRYRAIREASRLGSQAGPEMPIRIKEGGLLRERLEHFVGGTEPSLAVVGESGSGKSFALQMCEQILWDALSAGSNDRVPLHLTLTGEGDPVADALDTIGYTEKQLEELKQTPFLFLIDDCKKIPTSFPGWKGQIMTTCSVDVLGPQVTLLPIDAEQREAFLRNLPNGDRTIETINAHPELQELALSPLMVQLIHSTLPQVSSSKSLSKGELYDILVKGWYKQMKQRTNVPPLNEVRAHCGRVAFQMVKVGEGVAYPEAMGWQSLFSPDRHATIIASPLRQRHGGGYQFFHDSLVDYFASNHLIASLQGGADELSTFAKDSNTQEILKALEDHPLNQLTLKRELLSHLATRIDPTIEERLVGIVQASKGRPQVARAASNAISLLNRAGSSLAGRDFHGVHIPDANLDGAQLHYSNFKGGTLTRASLRRAGLTHVNFSDADLTGIELGETAPFVINTMIQHLRFAPDGHVVVACDDGSVRLYDTHHRQLVRHFEGHDDEVLALAIHKDLILSGSSDGQMILRNRDDVIHVFDDLDDEAVTAVAFSPDGRKALSAVGEEVMVWDLSTKKTQRTFAKHTDDVTCVAHHPQDDMIASGAKELLLWNSSGKVVARPAGHEADVTALAFSPQGQLASGDSRGTVIVWDLKTHTPCAVMRGHTKAITDITFSPDGNNILSCSEDKSLILWSLAGEQLESFQEEEAVQSATFSPDGKTILSGGYAKAIRFWQHGATLSRESLGSSSSVSLSETGLILCGRRLRHITAGRAILSLGNAPNTLISPDGKRALVSDAFALWNLEESTCKTFGGTVSSLAFSGDSSTFAGGTSDKVVVGNTKTLPLNGRIIALSYHGDRIAAGEIQLVVWDLAADKKVVTLDHQSPVKAVAFSPSGPIASVADTLTIWDSSGGKLHELGSAFSSSPALAFDPQGTRLASSTQETVIWDVSSGQERAKFPFRANALLLQEGSLLAADLNGSVRKWEERFEWGLSWTSSPQLLTEGCQIDGASGLSDENRKLLSGSSNQPRSGNRSN